MRSAKLLVFFLPVFFGIIFGFQNCGQSNISQQLDSSSHNHELSTPKDTQFSGGHGDLYDGKASYVYLGRACPLGNYESKIITDAGKYLLVREECQEIEPRLLETNKVSPHPDGIAFQNKLFFDAASSDELAARGDLKKLILNVDIGGDRASFELRNISFFLSCSVDSATARSCEGLVEYTNLSPGPHSFIVQARDAMGLLISEQAYYWGAEYSVMLDGQSRKWSDGSHAYSCNEYRNPTHDLYFYEGDIGDGLYSILIDGEAVDVFCDMTTDGGGWTRVIDGANTTANDLAKFGSTKGIKGSFYSNSSLGIGWGKTGQSANSWSEKSMTIGMAFSQVKIRFSGNYSNPTGGIGRLRVISGSKTLIRFSDSHRVNSSGQSLKILGKQIYNGKQIKEKNRLERIELGNSYSDLQLLMATHSNYPYTKRYIGELWLK